MVIAFNQIRSRMLCNRHTSLRAKLVMFNSIVVAVAVYACDVWNATEAQIQELEQVQFQMLKTMLGKDRKGAYVEGLARDKIVGKAAAVGVEIVPLTVLVPARKLKYLLTIECQPVDSITRQVLHAELDERYNARKPGRPKTSVRSAFRWSLRKFGIAEDDWCSVRADRVLGLKAIDLGQKRAMADWLASMVTARAEREQRESLRFQPLAEAILQGAVSLRTRTDFRLAAQEVVMQGVRLGCISGSRGSVSPESRDTLSFGVPVAGVVYPLREGGES